MASILWTNISSPAAATQGWRVRINMKLKSSIHLPSIMNNAASIGMDDIEDMLLSGSMSEAGSEWKADDSPNINQKM